MQSKKCLDVEKTAGCFRPTDPLIAPVSILLHTIYQNGQPIANAATLADDVLTPIDPNTFLGGGIITAGQCCCPHVSETSVCIRDDSGTVHDGYHVVSRESVSLTIISSVIEYYATDGSRQVAPSSWTVVNCCGCFNAATGETTCALLRLDADPGSLSQGTLEQYTIDFTSDCNGFEQFSFAGQALTVINTPNGDTIANFADFVNASLGAYGFRANYCGDTGIAQGISIVGPTGAGSWEVMINSNGSGDDFAVGWDEALGIHYSREWVNGVELTDGSSSYHPSGYWDVRGCQDCETP